jgi:hypothetical protein
MRIRATGTVLATVFAPCLHEDFPRWTLVLTPVPILDDPTIPRGGAEAGEGATD